MVRWRQRCSREVFTLPGPWGRSCCEVCCAERDFERLACSGIHPSRSWRAVSVGRALLSACVPANGSAPGCRKERRGRVERERLCEDVMLPVPVLILGIK